MSGEWGFLVIIWIGSVGAIGYSARPITDHQLDRWAIRFNVLIPDDAVETTRRQLRRARVIRWSAVVLGLNVGWLPMYVNVIDVERAGDFSNSLTAQAPFLAGALGAVIAEVAFVRPPVRRRRAAALVVRRWSDYVPTLWARCVVGFLPVSAIAALVHVGRDDPPWSTSWPWVGPAASALAIVAMTVGVHVVVNRPTLATDERDLRLDDALRADGVHHIVGASFAMGGVATANALAGVFGGVLGLVALLLSYAAIGVWYSLSTTDRWNVDQARLQRA